MTGKHTTSTDWAPMLAELERGLLQRDVAARALLLAALAGEHVLLLGPPGTAKSELARRLQRLLPGAHYFERLLTRFTVPEELFGPLSLRALEDDRYERLTEGYLPSAEVAFLDEVFKANSAILNTLLGLLHERQFDNGSQRLPVPLVCLVGASNEQPQDDSLLAFYDRFLLRVPVQPVDDAHFTALLLADAPGAGHTPANAQIHPNELQALRERAPQVALGETALALLLQARQHASDTGQTVSDRRWRQLVALLQLQAASRQASAVSPWDLWLLPFVLAADPVQVPGWTTLFMHAVARTAPLPLDGLERAVQAFESQLDTERRAPPDAQDDSAGKLALARAITRPGEESEMVRITSERALRRYSPVHIQARVAQCDELLNRLLALHGEWLAVAHAVLAQARAHPWLPPSWLLQIEAVHAERCSHLAGLCAQHQSTRNGFAALPVDEALTTLPAPGHWNAP
ncbi:MAG: AAA family ATPase [Hydrogenophaga sp.]|uniref:AAA family ATPase n=1 Tax=Hydrogenophaga sp. TaxID=1904254 RepID=UPI0027201FAA|nr:AAA family ATPase [Hydrogenophaga sp.]MDO9483773.1 AAA family ATPase [Hydrogenophaga sp.]MDP3346863.1 AAA family ATPase [Hydrogenophaga sp.]MDP3806805.1 AAA family ATPase [Hydrogenophaga sp.]